MKQVIKRRNIRIFPNEKQQELFAKTFGCYRFVYNELLSDRKESKERKRSLLELKEEFPFLKEVDASCLQQAQNDLMRAFKNRKKNPSFFKYPKYKSKKGRQSFRYTNQKFTILKYNKIKLCKIGNIKTKRIDLPENSRILSATFIQTSTGKYYVSICFETFVSELPKTGKKAGFDLGFAHFCISSDSIKYENPKFNQTIQDKISQKQRKLSKMRNKLKKAGLDLNDCKNYQKQMQILKKMYEHTKNQRKDFQNKLSSKLVKEYDYLAFEDIDIPSIIKEHRFAKSAFDASWGMFLGMISYKCDWYNKEFITIDRFQPTSSICSNCGNYHKELVSDLRIRKWTCPDCGTHHDRDINAAKNILNYALSQA